MHDTIIIWFRNDLRIRDNEAFYKAVQNADKIIPIYCVDPRLFARTQAFGFSKTGIFRAQFLQESLQDLQYQLQDLGIDLVIKYGKPETILFALARYHQAKAIYCHQAATSEEFAIEDTLDANLQTIGTAIRFFWDSTLHHFDDLPFELDDLPDTPILFEQKMANECPIRSTFPIPSTPKMVKKLQLGKLPTLSDLGINETFKADKRAVLAFKGGETAALQRLKAYFWESSTALQHYSKTKNQLLGSDYSSKFSAWLALGCISIRTIYEELQQYQNQHKHTESTRAFKHSLLQRDYHKFTAMYRGDTIFYPSGIYKNHPIGNIDWDLFNKWQYGRTGIPFIDANMRELLFTGFISHTGRTIVANFLVNYLGISWLFGAEYFESQLIDYDVCSNYINWNKLINTPKKTTIKHLITQAQHHDPEGLYTKYWCPELKRLPSTRLHEPYLLSNTEQSYLGLQIGIHYPKPCIEVQ